MKAGFSKRVSWRVEAAVHSLIAAILGKFPPETVFVLGEGLGRLIWPLMKKRQLTIIRNLRIAVEESRTLEEIHEMARASFVRTVANLLSSTAAERSTPEQIKEILEIENPELLQAALDKGRGVVVLLGHMGNWELLAQMRCLFPDGAKLGAFYRPLNNPILNERVLKQRESDGTKLFSKRDSLHQVAGFLRDNGAIGILSDQRVGRQGEVASYFGRLTRVSPLPSLLVRRCKSEVLAMSLRTEAPGRWVARCHPVSRPASSVNCMEAVEAAMKVSILDVFWLQERWRLYFGPKSNPSTWIGDETARSEKPHRALIWMKESESGEELPACCLHGDIRYERAVGKEPEDLKEIDEGQRLPIDFILCFSKDSGLKKTAKELGIPVYPVSMFSE